MRVERCVGGEGRGGREIKIVYGRVGVGGVIL